jgi:DNA-binding MarR family transcriptional regulator
MTAWNFTSQLETLATLQVYIRRNGYSPTLDELATMRGVSITTIQKHIRQLQERGYIQRVYRKHRNIRLGRAA